jgi:hypothetical protein
LRKIYFILADKFHQSISESDSTEFYMMEYLLQDLEEKITEENKRHKKQESEYQKQSQSPKSPGQPKIGDTNYGGFKTPKLNIPKMQMPKF